MRRAWNERLSFAALLVAIGLIAAACNNDTNAGSGMSLQIVGPADGDSVTSPFEVKLDASVDLGDPDTGKHHVHLCFDGGSCDTEYTLGYGDTIEVKDLAPGEHTIEARLRNADHSDAGASDTITVTVGAAGGTDSGSPTQSASRGGYGY
jgi:hypothetical protein